MKKNIKELEMYKQMNKMTQNKEKEITQLQEKYTNLKQEIKVLETHREDIHNQLRPYIKQRKQEITEDLHNHIRKYHTHYPYLKKVEVNYLNTTTDCLTITLVFTTFMENFKPYREAITQYLLSQNLYVIQAHVTVRDL